MATIDTVEVGVTVRLKVLVGGTYDEPQYDGQAADAQTGCYPGPTQLEAVRAELAQMEFRRKRFRVLDWLFGDTERPVIVGVSKLIRTVSSEYASGE